MSEAEQVPGTPGPSQTGLSRRGFLMGTGATAGLALAARMTPARARLGDNPFTLGVASGDPRPNSVVLWTRLAPRPLVGGGMPRRNVEVRWQLATDPRFSKVVRSGAALARPEFAHSLHVAPEGLQSARWYWYRFGVGSYISRVGRTRTMPPANGTPGLLRFAFVSCQDYQAGYYHAYHHLAQEDLDLVIHLGDYIYEYGPEPTSPRPHTGDETTSLADYRNRHALYKTDPDLQDAHARFPWIVTFDDHEVENNYADEQPESGSETPSQQAFLKRRARAYRAYYEHLPLRRSSLPQGSNMRIYRRVQFGRLAGFHVLDTRQYRSDQPCGDGIKERCAEALAPSQTMTGPAQERWLLNGLGRSSARWNLVAQQTMLAEYDFFAGPGELFNLDQWDGYVAARRRLTAFLKHNRPSNPIVLTGDIHSSWVHDIKTDFSNESSPTVATEFVGTSITSDFPPPFIAPVEAARMDNPHTKFFDGTFRGYVRCALRADRMRVDFRTVSDVKNPSSSPVTTLASFVVENGHPGAHQVSGATATDPAPARPLSRRGVQGASPWTRDV